MTRDDFWRVRTWLGLSQEKFARLLLVSAVSVNRWEKGSTKPKGVVLEILRALECVRARATAASDVLGESSVSIGVLYARIFRLAYGNGEGDGP